MGWTGSNGSTAQRTVTINSGSKEDKSYTATWSTSAVGKYNNENYDLLITNGYTFVKIFNQDVTGGYFAQNESVILNTGNKDSYLYSRLGIMQNLKTSAETKYVFRLYYPEQTARTNIWKQTNRPQDETEYNGDGSRYADGYEAISINSTGNNWGGLVKSISGGSYIDGTTYIVYWWYAIATYAYYSPNGMPGPNSITVSKVQLWLATDANKFTFP